MKRSTRLNKIVYMDEVATETQAAAKMCDTGPSTKSQRHLEATSSTHQTLSRTITKRCAEHFWDILNGGDPEVAGKILTRKQGKQSKRRGHNCS